MLRKRTFSNLMKGLAISASAGIVVAGVTVPAWFRLTTAGVASVQKSDNVIRAAGLKAETTGPLAGRILKQADGDAGKTDQELVGEERSSLAAANPNPASYFDKDIPAVTTPQPFTPALAVAWGFKDYALKPNFTYSYTIAGTSTTDTPGSFERVEATIIVGLAASGSPTTATYAFTMNCYKTNWTAIAQKIAAVATSSLASDAFLAVDNEADATRDKNVSTLKSKAGVDLDLAGEIGKTQFSVLWEKKAGESSILFKQVNIYSEDIPGNALTQTFTYFAKSDQQLANEEQAVVNALVATKTYYFDESTAAFTDEEATSASLADYGIALVRKDGYTYRLSAPSLTSTGTLAVTVTVAKGRFVAAGARPISVDAVKTNWTSIANKIATLTITTADEPAFKAVAKTDQPLSALGTELGIVTDWQNLVDRRTTLVWSKVAGSAVVTFDLYSGTSLGSAGTKLKTGAVTVDSFAESASTLVNREKAVVSSLTSSHPYYFDQSAAAIANQDVTPAQLEAFGLALTLKNGLTYKWTVPALTASGAFSVTITISKDAVSAAASPVSVAGVRTNWTNVLARINALSSSSFNIWAFRGVDKTDQPAASLSSELGIATDVGTHLGPDLSLVWSKPAGSTSVFFELYGVAADGGRGMSLATASVTIVSFVKTAQDLLDEEQAAVNALVSSSPYYFDQDEEAVIGAPATRALLLPYHIPFAPKNGFTYFWSHVALYGSTSLAIRITVWRGTLVGQPQPIVVTAVKTNWTRIAERFATLTASRLTDTAFKAVSKVEQPLSGLSTDLGIADSLSSLVGSGVMLVWSKEANSAAVTFDLYASTGTGTKGAKLRSGSVTVVSFAKSPQQEVDEEQAVVNALVSSATYYFDRTVTAVDEQNVTSDQLAELGIALVAKSGFTYRLTVPALSASGPLAVTILVAKDTVVGTPVPITVNAVRTNWTELSSLIDAITSSSLPEAKLKAVVGTDQPLSDLGSVLGIASDLVPAVSAGTSLWWSKTADSSVVTFNLYEGSVAGSGQKILKSKNATINSFEFASDQPVSADSDSSANLGAIIGGTVGGVAGAAGIAGLTTYLIRRNKTKVK